MLFADLMGSWGIDYRIKIEKRREKVVCVIHNVMKYSNINFIFLKSLCRMQAENLKIHMENWKIFWKCEIQVRKIRAIDNRCRGRELNLSPRERVLCSLCNWTTSWLKIYPNQAVCIHYSQDLSKLRKTLQFP